jgi:hypothetical protein
MPVTSGFVHDFALTEIIPVDIMLKSTVSKRSGNLTPNYTKMHCFRKTISYKLTLGFHAVKHEISRHRLQILCLLSILYYTFSIYIF